MNRTSRVCVAVAAATLGLSGLAACGSSSPSSSSSASSAPSSSAASPSSSGSSASTASSAKIMIKDFKYSGASSVKPGTKITVTNGDSVAHTVTADSSGGFDVNVPPGKSATFTAPKSAGTYKFHCTYHSNMHGTLKVS